TARVPIESAGQFDEQRRVSLVRRARLRQKLDALLARRIPQTTQSSQQARRVAGKQLEQAIQTPRLLCGIRVVEGEVQPRFPDERVVRRSSFPLPFGRGEGQGEGCVGCGMSDVGCWVFVLRSCSLTRALSPSAGK